MPTSTSGFLRSFFLKKENISSWDRYPYSLPIIQSLKAETALDPQITFLIGENGTGKSTLIEAIATAAGFNPEGGSKNFNFSTQATHSPLHETLQLVRNAQRETTGFFLRAESFYNVASYIDELDKGGGGQKIIKSYGGKSLHNQSHGESFMALVEHRFGPKGLYILDEPEAALSPRRQLHLLYLIHRLIGEGSQFIIATHSPLLLAFPQALIYELSAKGLTTPAYEETNHYQTTRNFLENHALYMQKIMEQE